MVVEGFSVGAGADESVDEGIDEGVGEGGVVGLVRDEDDDTV